MNESVISQYLSQDEAVSSGFWIFKWYFRNKPFRNQPYVTYPQALVNRAWPRQPPRGHQGERPRQPGLPGTSGRPADRLTRA